LVQASTTPRDNTTTIASESNHHTKTTYVHTLHRRICIFIYSKSKPDFCWRRRSSRVGPIYGHGRSTYYKIRVHAYLDRHVASVVDLGELWAVHGLRDLVGARAAPAAAVVPAVAASPPAVAAVAAARVAAPAPPATARVAATAGVATPTAPAAAGVAAATVVLHVSLVVIVVLPRLCMIQHRHIVQVTVAES